MGGQAVSRLHTGAFIKRSRSLPISTRLGKDDPLLSTK